LADLDVVTGVYSYTGGFIAQELLRGGREVRTLSRRPEPGHPLAGKVQEGALQFADRDRLLRDLAGADTLYNTYWIRYEQGGRSFDAAVRNTRTLVEAARDAGIRRVVHISVSNPSETSAFAYFRGKAATEREVRAVWPSAAIVRPTLVYGASDLLLNNIAWILRRFPLFLVPDGRVQPVAGEDVAELAVAAGEAETIDAAGPEVYEFADLVRMLGRAAHGRARVVRAPTALGLGLTAVANRFLRDIVVTREELEALAAGLLLSSEPPRGRRSFADWVEASGRQLGTRYVSELERNFRPYAPV
jgi:NADH dehydrogenase